MFTATIKSKEETERGLQFTVEFTDGTKVIENTVIPADEDGLIYFAKSELDRFNARPALETKYKIGKVIDVVETVVTPVLSARDEWFTKLNRIQRIKTYAIDLGVIPADDAEFLRLQEDVKDTYSPTYLSTF